MPSEISDSYAGQPHSSEKNHVDFSQYVLDEPAKQKTERNFDASAPAPETAARRVLDVTINGIMEIPAGFINSLDPNQILPNVGMGFAIGAGTKLVLNEGGPVAKAATGLMAAYFLGKPMVETYGKAIGAENMGDMQDASRLFGNTVGGIPVTMAEGAVGAYAGSKLTGALLSTRAAAPFVEWKARQYNKLDAHFDNGYAALNNAAFNKLLVGKKIMIDVNMNGIVPPYMLEELAARNPHNPAFLETIKKTEALKPIDRVGTSNAARIDNAGAREVYDARGQEHVGTKVRAEGDVKTGITDVDNCYDYTGEVRSLYKDVYNRNSIDNKGMKLESTVHYGENFENAFWDGERMTYGKPGADSPFNTFVLRDVTGHEMSHGVTQFESNLVYRGQPGALNESLSDVFGALVEQRVKNQTAGEASWLVGDGIWKSNVKGRALRDMLNPGTAYDDVNLGKDPQPAHMKDYIVTRSDNGGVHLNSGIPNRAFALFAKDVGGYAWDKPGQIWYKARALAGSEPSFAQFAHHTVEAAKALGHTAEVAKLQKAWSDVGITPSLVDKGIPKVGLPLMMANPDKKLLGGP